MNIEEITTTPTFKNQLKNKILFSNHSTDICISYRSTFTLKYVMEGIKYYRYNDQDIEVSKNHYVLLNNDSQITTMAEKGTKGLSLFLSPKLINEIYHFQTNRNTSFEFLEVTQKKSNSQLELLLDKIIHHYEYGKIDFQQKIDDLFIHICELLVEEQLSIDNKFSSLKIVKHNTKKELLKLIMDAKEYLNDNLKEEISLDTMSRTIGISKYYLHRLFTEINGITPLSYLTSIRLEEAKNKLRYSKDAILEIAISCGFDNASYFSNTFKKHTGYSPSMFRGNL